MNCEQFQEVLPHILEQGGNEEEERHLRTCRACAELVQDLKYIAEQARLLLPMYDPSPRVWSSIEHALHREGLLQEGRMSRPGHLMTTYLPIQAKSWTPVGWAMALATLAVFTVALVNYSPHVPAAHVTAQNSVSQAARFNSDDQRLIRRVSQEAPEVSSAYETSLREANAYIEDAQQAVDRDPDDDAAQEQLQQAYQQKETLYQMAVARSLP